MIAQSLNLVFAAKKQVEDTAWVRLEQVGLKTVTATIGQTAELVNGIYQIAPCHPNPVTAGESLTKDKFQTLVKNTFDLSLCDTNPNGNTPIQIRVILSDPAVTYALHLSDPNTIIGSTTVIEEVVSLRLTIQDVDHLVLPWPVMGAINLGWAGAVFNNNGYVYDPPVILNGNTINFSEELTGIVTAEYKTKYYIIDITLVSEDQCRALCFYQGLVGELDIVKPESQGSLSEWQQYCNPQDKWIFPIPNVTCYEDIELSWRCECDTNQEIRNVTIQQDVECPAGFAEWGMEPGAYKIGDRYEIAGYEHCPDLVTNYGALDLSDPDYYMQTCCEAPKVSLPNCRTVVSKFYGGVSIENGEAYYLDIYGQGTKIIPVSPTDGDCGIVETTQVVIAKDCCDGVTPIYFDEANSTEIIADNSKGLVKVTGGRAPYHWQVRGSGFWANAACTWRDVENDTPFLWIYTKDACGVCYVWCNDGCSDQSWLIKSAIGQWVQLNSDDTTSCAGVQLDCGPITQLSWNECIRGKYKINEFWNSFNAYCPIPTESIASAASKGCAISLDLNGPRVPSCAFGPPVVNVIGGDSMLGSGVCADDPANFWQYIYRGLFNSCADSTGNLSHYGLYCIYNTEILAYEWRC